MAHLPKYPYFHPKSIIKFPSQNVIFPLISGVVVECPGGVAFQTSPQCALVTQDWSFYFLPYGCLSTAISTKCDASDPLPILPLFAILNSLGGYLVSSLLATFLFCWIWLACPSAHFCFFRKKCDSRPFPSLWWLILTCFLLYSDVGYPDE